MNNQYNFLFPNFLNYSLYKVLKEAIISANFLLYKFASKPSFTTKLQIAFGQNIDLSQLENFWQARETIFPEIEIVNRTAINHGNGAFAQETNKIYLAQEFLWANKHNLDAITHVILEEYGHFIDSKLNTNDAPGDEGAIFAALVQDVELSNEELKHLKQENDRAVVIFEQKKVEIEQNNNETTTLLSVGTNGTLANNSSFEPSISANGRYVAFSSSASNLISDDTNNYRDIFVRDRKTGTTARVSIANDGTSGNSYSLSPSISADGRYVAFSSSASNLVPDDNNNKTDIFVRDRQTGTTERVSIAPDGTSANSDSLSPSISADGRYVVFQSKASNLVPEDINGQDDIFIYDRQTKITERVSVTVDGNSANDLSSEPSISADGRYIAFLSEASNLVPGDINGERDIFVRDRQTGTTEKISVAVDGNQANNESAAPSISADGRYVAFQSKASNLIANDTNGQIDIFVRDRQTGITERVNVAADGNQANDLSLLPSINADGRYITFQSWATNLVPDDTNNKMDIFVYDRQKGNSERVSVATNNNQANDLSLFSSISANGKYVAFSSSASNLVSEDTNNSDDIFIRNRDLEGPTIYRFYNTNSGVHFYTASEQEKQFIQDNLSNYTLEGSAYIGVSEPDEIDSLTGAKPVYRFYNTNLGVHLYTINEVEKQFIIDELTNYNYEGVAYYAHENPNQDTIPVYRFYNTILGVHFYTPSAKEKDFVVNNLPHYRLEGEDGVFFVEPTREI